MSAILYQFRFGRSFHGQLFCYRQSQFLFRKSQIDHALKWPHLALIMCKIGQTHLLPPTHHTHFLITLWSPSWLSISIISSQICLPIPFLCTLPCTVLYYLPYYYLSQFSAIYKYISTLVVFTISICDDICPLLLLKLCRRLV